MNLRKNPSQLGTGQACKEESGWSNFCWTAVLRIFFNTSSSWKDLKSSTTNGEGHS